MIKTKPYSLSKKEYAKIVIKKRFKKSWWIYSLLIITALFHIKNFGQDNFSTFYVIFAFTYPLAIFVWLYFWAISKDNKPIFEKAELEFNESHIVIKRAGLESKIPFNKIDKVIPEKGYWMLYISKREFLHVNKDIFYSNDDYSMFCKLINQEA
ncbi:YcxB family protein [Meridianimaribacter flavus]|uniref:YcxB-like protein n=1 Tax=Meridianimaribacter flavus TaxID=571115 RepID=A0ABY2G6C6_9FLAO|nr:YcxB family protein [Meridianimaribacter flavus]TDY12612.1 YcxB-like protein [Meridianimaribacter flavus]